MSPSRLVAVCLLICTSACGGGGGGGGSSQAPPPTVSLSSDNTNVPAGSSITLTWSSTNASSCAASGAWSGNEPTTGSTTISGLMQTSSFALSCTGTGGTAQASVSVTVIPPPPLPTVTISATSMTVAMAATDTLNWTTANATSCTASGDWSGSQATSGSTSVGPITRQATYTLTCDGPGGIASNSVSVAVSQTLPPATPIAVLNAGVVILDDATASALIQSTSTSLTFTGAIPITVGEVFLLSGSAYLATTVAQANGQTTVTVTPPSLDQLFSSFTITGTYQLSPNQVVSQSSAARDFMALQRRPGAVTVSTSIPLPLSYTSGSISIQGSGNLSLTATPNIQFSLANGLAGSTLELDSTLSAQATLTVTGTATVPWTTLYSIGTYRINIPVTLVGSALQLLGINVASIQIPVSVGFSGSTELTASVSPSVSLSNSTLLSVAQDGSFSATELTPQGANALTIGGVNLTPDASVPEEVQLTLTAFPAIEARPGLAILNTVAFLGVDLKLGPKATVTFEVTGSGASLGYCGSYSGAAQLEANAFYKGIGNVSYTWPASGALDFTLASFGPAPLAAQCGLLPIVTVTPQAAAVLFSSLTVGVQVSPPSSGVPSGTSLPSGSVTLTLDGSSCMATLDSNGTGSCSVTPGTPGARSLTYSYSGDTNYMATIPASQSIDVALADTVTTLSASPMNVLAGSSVTFNTAVAPSPPGSGSQPLPTQTIAIKDESGTTVCDITLDPTATGSCTYTEPLVATHAYTASYSGDANYNPSSSQPVTVTVTGLTISPSASTVTVGGTLTLSVTNESGNPVPVTWQCSDTSVAAVSPSPPATSASGTVTGVAPGTATIQVQDPVSLATASTSVTVGSPWLGTWIGTNPIGGQGHCGMPATYNPVYATLSAIAGNPNQFAFELYDGTPYCAGYPLGCPYYTDTVTISGNSGSSQYTTLTLSGTGANLQIQVSIPIYCYTVTLTPY